MDIYNKYKSVPQTALKSFDNGTFKGTDINSMWRIKCLTEQFGVVGFGWTIKTVRLWTETINDEVLAFAEIELRIKVNGEWSEPISATGGNKMCTYIKSKDYYKSSDEAFKMAITDAFGVACKYLGIGADVYWENDKSKYNENEEAKVSTNELDSMTLEQAKAFEFIGKGNVKYQVGNLPKEQLQLLTNYDKMPDLKQAATLVLQSLK